MNAMSRPTDLALEAAVELAVQQRARASIQTWLAAGHSQASVLTLHTLQRPAQGHAVFACDVEIRGASAAPPTTRRVIAKCLPVRGFAATAQRATLVHQAIQAADTRVLGAPAVLYADEAQQVLLLEPARGELLADLPASEPARLVDAVARCSAALKELHQLPVFGLVESLGGSTSSAKPVRTSIDGPIAQLMRPHPADLAAALAAQAPDSSQQVQHLLERLQEASACCADVTPCLVHQDVHPRQMFVDAERIDVVDWDLCGLGDPALDLANLHLHIDLRWPQLAEHLHACVTSSYGANASVHGRLPLFLAFHHLRRACKAWRQAGSDHSTLGPAAPWLASAAFHLADFLDGRAATHGDMSRAARTSQQPPVSRPDTLECLS